MKRILITGASSGIGRQLALDYAAEGHHVIACGRDLEKLQSLQAQYNAIEIKTFDMTDWQATQTALTAVSADLVILVAGTCEYVNNGHIEAALFKRVLDTNILGPVNCLEILLPQLQAGAQLALVGSMSAWFPFPRAEAYGASKAALAYLARSLSVSLTQAKIDVSLIEPGFVDTPLTKKNDFPMPTLISVEEASQYIRQGLAEKKTHITFPKRLVIALRFLSWFPFSLQKKMALKMLKGTATQ